MTAHKDRRAVTPEERGKRAARLRSRAAHKLVLASKSQDRKYTVRLRRDADRLLQAADEEADLVRLCEQCAQKAASQGAPCRVCVLAEAEA